MMWKREYTIVIIVSVVATLLIPWLFTRSWLYDWTGCEAFVYCDTGEIGDTIGGITAPFVGILSAFLTYYLLRHQLERESQQTADYKKDCYERQLFELLNQHNRVIDRIGMEKISEFYLNHQVAYTKIECLCQNLDERISLKNSIFYCLYYGVNKNNIFKIITKIGDENFRLFLKLSVGKDFSEIQDTETYLNAFTQYVADNTDENKLSNKERDLLQRGYENTFSGFFEITTFILRQLKGHDEYAALAKAYYSEKELMVLLLCSKFNKDKTFVKLINSWQ